MSRTMLAISVAAAILMRTHNASAASATPTPSAAATPTPPPPAHEGEATAPTPAPLVTPTPLPNPPAPAPGIAGYDGGIFIQDATGNYKLKINEMAQFRYYLNRRPKVDAATGDREITNGYELTNARITFAGNLIDPKLTYLVEGEFGKDDGLYGAPFNYYLKYAKGFWALKIGQFKLPVMHEEIVSQKYQLAADSSISNEVFSQDYSQGVEVDFKNNNVNVQWTANDGIAKPNSAYSTGQEADFATTARVEYKLGEKAEWKRFDDFSSWRGSTPFAALLGAAAHFETYGGTAVFVANSAGGLTGTSFPRRQFIEWTVDASFEGNGWNAYAAVIGGHNAPVGETATNDMGVVLQGGMFVSDNLEPFVRFDEFIPDSKRDAAENKPFRTLKGGANYYFVPKSHNAKLTVDFQYFMDRASETAIVSDLANDNDVGLLPGGKAGQFVGEAQMQWLF